MADTDNPAGHPADPPTPPSGELIVPPANPPSTPPAVRPPSEPIDPEQVRQFQQFQQFQELMRQQKEQGFPQGEPPPPGFLQPWGPPPPKPNPVKRALKAAVGKIVTAVLVVLLLLAAGYFAWDYFFDNAPSQPPASEIGGGKTEDTLLFETNPRLAVRRVYEDIAQGDSTRTCDRFTEEAREQFTTHFAELGASCVDVVKGLKAQVVKGQKSEYANPFIPSSAGQPTGDSVQLSSCAMEVTGGPRLGLFTVSKIENSVEGQWIISAHERETCSVEPSAPPTT